MLMMTTAYLTITGKSGRRILSLMFTLLLGIHLYGQTVTGGASARGTITAHAEEKGIARAETRATTGPSSTPSPRWAVKTNVAGWATASLNAAAEVRVAPKLSLNVGLSYNPFTYKENKKWKHILVQPELRYWLCAPFGGHYIGGHLIYSHYNAGGAHLPFGLWSGLKENRYQGDLYAVGFTYGYSWILSPHWSIEAAAGIGYGFTRYKHYECRTCGNYKGTENRHLFMPTKLALSFIYIIK